MNTGDAWQYALLFTMSFVLMVAAVVCILGGQALLGLVYAVGSIAPMIAVIADVRARRKERNGRRGA